MPVPAEYERASDHFYRFLIDVRDRSGVGSTHQAYTMVQGVLQTFRRRLGIKEAIAFANLLPIGLRALFVTDWDTEEPVEKFEDSGEMLREVRSLRPDHNFSPDSAISDVAWALRRNVDEGSLDRLLEGFPEGAVDFWKP